MTGARSLRQLLLRSASQRGYVLLPVILAVALVAAAAYMMDREGVINIRLLDNALEGQRAEYVAHAGLQHAHWLTAQQGCGPYTDLSNQPLGSDRYSSILTTDLGGLTSFTVAVDQDTWIDSNSPTDTHGDDNRLRIRFEGGREERPLYHYDLSAITPGSEILSATAWFYTTGKHPEGPLTLHRVTAAWTEDDATWETVGDAIEPAVLASIPPVDRDGTWVAVNLTAQVQAWVNGQPNHGITLRTDVEGLQGDYAPREQSTQPYLEVVVGTPPSSPATLKSVGTLASGVSRVVQHADTVLRQRPEMFLQLQPGPDQGRDGYLYEWQSTWNFGAKSEIWADNRFINSRANGLLRFEFARIPRGARVTRATLELYQTNESLNGGPIAVHRINAPWAEGDKNGGIGIPNWTEREAGALWTTAGGDYAAAAAATTTVPSGEGWSSWDITTLVDDWVAGRFVNHGMALIAGPTGTAGHFASSDATDPTLRPRLTVTYSCACGSPCLAPQGQGRVLMVVINPTTLVSADAAKKALFESWGYAVSVVGESSNQATYDAAVAVADVVLISETVNANQVGTKLKDVAIGVVSQDGNYNDDLGLAAGSAWPVAAALEITDTTHFITAPFRAGPLAIYEGGMEQLTVSGSEAVGLQTLAQTGGAGSLAVLDKGATTLSGASAAGRRVMLPLGRDPGLAWDYLTAEGRLLVQRALAWGMGADLASAPPKNLLFVSGGTTVTAFPSGDMQVIPTVLEQARIDLIESWGYTVNLIADDDSQASFDVAVSDNDVVYVSAQVSETALATKLRGAALGIVNEQGLLVDEFGFGQQSVTYKSRTEIDVLDNGHYITEPFATGPLTILDASQMLQIMTANKGPAFQALAQVFNTGSLWDDALGVIGSGGELYGGGSAAGRRVLLPWGDATFDVGLLNADGLTLMQRAIEWAEGAGSDPVPGSSILFVVANPAAPTAGEAARKTLMESWGFTVALIDDAETQVAFDAATATADAAYVSEAIDDAQLATKLKAATIGVVNEDPALHSVFGFSTVRYFATDNAPLKTDPVHYITEPFAGAEITLFSAGQPMGAAVGTLAAGLDTIGAWSSGALAPLGGLLTLDSGAALAGGGNSAGRRVQTPWGGQDGVSVTDIGALSADGATVMRRALEWAVGLDTGGGGGPSCAATVADDFESGGYGGSTGTLPWAGDWLEVFESDGPGAGDEKVVSFGGDLVALVKDKGQGGSGEGLEREADLSGYASATLGYTYWRDLGNNDSVTVQVSADGGTTWQDVTIYNGSATDNEASPQSASFDISPHISTNTRIRFMTGSSNGNGDGLYFDDLEICLGN